MQFTQVRREGEEVLAQRQSVPGDHVLRRERGWAEQKEFEGFNRGPVGLDRARYLQDQEDHNTEFQGESCLNPVIFTLFHDKEVDIVRSQSHYNDVPGVSMYISNDPVALQENSLGVCVLLSNHTATMRTGLFVNSVLQNHQLVRARSLQTALYCTSN